MGRNVCAGAKNNSTSRKHLPSPMIGLCVYGKCYDGCFPETKHWYQTDFVVNGDIGFYNLKQFILDTIYPNSTHSWGINSALWVIGGNGKLKYLGNYLSLDIDNGMSKSTVYALISLVQEKYGNLGRMDRYTIVKSKRGMHIYFWNRFFFEDISLILNGVRHDYSCLCDAFVGATHVRMSSVTRLSFLKHGTLSRLKIIRDVGCFNTNKFSDNVLKSYHDFVVSTINEQTDLRRGELV